MGTHALRPGEDKDEAACRRRAARMDMVDAYPPEVRELVHDYGLSVVQVLLAAGVKSPRHVRAVVRSVLTELSPISGGGSLQGHGIPKAYTPKGWKLVPEEPTAEMLRASLDYLDNWRADLTPEEVERYRRGGSVYMGDREKHAGRYRAMVKAAP